MSGENREHHFLHREHRVAIVVWPFATQVLARAEIYHSDDLVCVLTRSALPHRSAQLLQVVFERAIRWIDRRLH